MRTLIQCLLVGFLVLGSLTVAVSQAAGQEPGGDESTLCLCTVNETTYQADAETERQTYTTTVLDRFTYFDPSGVCLEHVLDPPPNNRTPPSEFELLSPVTHTQCQAMVSEPQVCLPIVCNKHEKTCWATCPTLWALFCCT